MLRTSVLAVVFSLTSAFGATVPAAGAAPAAVMQVAPTVVDVTGTVRHKIRWHRTAFVTLSADPLPADATEGAPLRWEVAVGRELRAALVQHAGEVERLVFPFERFSGRHRIQILKNGAWYAELTVRTGRGHHRH